MDSSPAAWHDPYGPWILISFRVTNSLGLGGTGAGVGTIAAIYVTGWVSDRYSFEPMLIGASIIPLLGMLAVLVFVRNNRATEQGVVKPI